MEGKFNRKTSNDHIPERKPSYRKAVDANTTENQVKTVSFEKASHPVVVFNSDNEISNSVKGKKIIFGLFIEFSA